MSARTQAKTYSCSQGATIDLAWKLDSKGERHGKVIPYKISEARIIDILDKICPAMTKYTKGETTDGDRTLKETVCFGWK